MVAVGSDCPELNLKRNALVMKLAFQLLTDIASGEPQGPSSVRADGNNRQAKRNLVES